MTHHPSALATATTLGEWVKWEREKKGVQSSLGGFGSGSKRGYGAAFPPIGLGVETPYATLGTSLGSPGASIEGSWRRRAKFNILKVKSPPLIGCGIFS